MTWKEKCTKAYNDGKVLKDSTMGTITFKLLGVNFSSNPNRMKAYKFNHHGWLILNKTTTDKWLMIFRGEVTPI
jgi:hypothetical protein